MDPEMKPHTYQAGERQVIEGMDVGCLGMKLGEKRLLTIPPDEGYGADGFPEWGIPRYATLNFVVQVLQINW